MRVLFLNQYFPPDPAPTGSLFSEIGDRLAAAGHTIDRVGASQSYDAQRHRRRIVRELSALGSIFSAGLHTPHPDVIVAGSSPPCLPVVAAALAKRHGARLVLWAMDLYPELAIALGEIGEGIVSCATGALMRRAYRLGEVVAVDEDMRVFLLNKGFESTVIAPWVPGVDEWEPAESVPGPVFQWLYSGNLGRAHEWETLLESQAILEKRGCPARLVFQGGGASWSPAQQRAAELNLAGCEFRPYAPKERLVETLLESRVLVASQRNQARGLLWPSKLALLRRVSRPLLWIGAADGAISRELRDRPDTACFQPGEADGIADWLESEFAREPKVGQLDLVGLREDRESAIRRWVELI